MSLKKEIVTDAISFIEPSSSLAFKYLFNLTGNPKKSISNRLRQIENDLGLTKKNLSNKELALIKYILNIAHSKNESLNNIDIKCQEIQSILKLSNEDLKDIEYSLGNLLKVRRATSNYCEYRLNYSLYWETNFLELICGNSLIFENLLFKMTKFLYENKDGEINVNVFEGLFTIEQINILLAYYEQINLTKIIRNIGTEFYYESFFINKNILYELYDKLRE